MEMSNSVDRFTNVLKKFTGRNEKYGTMDEFMNDLCGVWSQLTKDERDTVSKILMGKKLNNNRVDDLLHDINNGFNSSPMKEDKKNIEKLVSVTEDMLKQKAVDEINNKNEPKITISVSIGTVDLHCKKCGAHLVNRIPKQYSPFMRECTDEETKKFKDLENAPTIKYEIVSDTPCDQCGCNLMDADIKIAIDNSLRHKD